MVYSRSLLIVLSTILLACTEKAPLKTEYIGKPIPSIKLLLTDSISYDSTGNIPAGKPTVLLSFGPHCPYSRAQVQEIVDDMQRLQDIQFYIFTTGSFSDMKEFYTHYQLNKFPNVTVGLDVMDAFGKYFKIEVVPYMAIYGRNGRLNASFMGEVNSKQIKKEAEDQR